MRAESRELRVREVTHGALVGLLSRVESRVVAQRRGLRETFLAVFTLERFLERVDSHVRTEVATGIEPPATYSAFETSILYGRYFFWLTHNDTLFFYERENKMEENLDMFSFISSSF